MKTEAEIRQAVKNLKDKTSEWILGELESPVPEEIKTFNYHCDLCHNKNIDVENGNQYMLNSSSDYQSWPTSDGKVVEVCRQCCEILKLAKKYGAIDYDHTVFIDQKERELYERLKVKYEHKTP